MQSNRYRLIEIPYTDDAKSPQKFLNDTEDYFIGLHKHYENHERMSNNLNVMLENYRPGGLFRAGFSI